MMSTVNIWGNCNINVSSPNQIKSNQILFKVSNVHPMECCSDYSDSDRNKFVIIIDRYVPLNI